MDIDQKWDKVKTFYESHYFDGDFPKHRFRFQSRPSALVIETLFDKMQKFKKSMFEFYEQDPGMEKRLLAFHSKSVLKRSAHD